MMRRTKVMCFGTFDVLHPGHVAFLSQARALGSELYVVVAIDARRAKLSGKQPILTQKERMIMLDALKVVSHVLPGTAKDILYHVKKVRPDIIVLGHDQTFGVDELHTWMDEQDRPPQLVRLRAFKRARYSTSRIKRDICKQMEKK